MFILEFLELLDISSCFGKGFIPLQLYFFNTYLLVSVITIIRVNIMFLILLVEILLLVSISISKDSQRCSKICTKAINYILLYLFSQQLVINIILLNSIY